MSVNVREKTGVGQDIEQCFKFKLNLLMMPALSLSLHSEVK